MQVVLFLAPFVLIGIAVVFIAFSGGPGRAREAYLTRAGRGFRVVIPLVYVGLGLVVPALVIAARGGALGGGGGALEVAHASPQVERGKDLFRNTCSSCHTLAAVNARGITGPDLDGIGEVTTERVLAAIETGGTGDGRMPAGLLDGPNADAVAAFVAAVAGKSQ